jgi:hypothetical protein
MEFSLGPGCKALFFTITPDPSYIMFDIPHGTNLNDPISLLQGKGKIHRQIKQYRTADLENPAFESLIPASV